MNWRNKRLDHSKKSTEKVLNFFYDKLFSQLVKKGAAANYGVEKRGFGFKDIKYKVGDITIDGRQMVPGYEGFDGMLYGTGPIRIYIRTTNKGYHAIRLHAGRKTYEEEFIRESELNGILERIKSILGILH